MLLTDADARKQECPVKTYCVNEVDVVQNGQVPFHAQQPCQGSDCKMAWRWGVAPKHMNDEAPLFGFRERGYCGLAGRPEQS